MTAEADQLRSNNQRMHDMLCRVVNELSDPTGEQWCDCPDEDRDLIWALHADVDRFLEDL